MDPEQKQAESTQEPYSGGSVHRLPFGARVYNEELAEASSARCRAPYRQLGLSINDSVRAGRGQSAQCHSERSEESRGYSRVAGMPRSFAALRMTRSGRKSTVSS